MQKIDIPRSQFRQRMISLVLNQVTNMVIRELQKLELSKWTVHLVNMDLSAAIDPYNIQAEINRHLETINITVHYSLDRSS